MSSIDGIAHIGKPDPSNWDRGQARYSYCGRYTFYEFSLLHLDHAESCIALDTRVQPCKRCLKKARAEQAK